MRSRRLAFVKHELDRSRERSGRGRGRWRWLSAAAAADLHGEILHAAFVVQGIVSIGDAYRQREREGRERMNRSTGAEQGESLPPPALCSSSPSSSSRSSNCSQSKPISDISPERASPVQGQFKYFIYFFIFF